MFCLALIKESPHIENEAILSLAFTVEKLRDAKVAKTKHILCRIDLVKTQFEIK